MAKEFFIRRTETGWQNVRAWKNYTESLKPGKYRVVIEETTKRSNPQNDWLHAILPEIAQGLRDAGYDEVKTPEDAKDVLKALFFKKKVSNGVDEIDVIEGTSKQSKLAFAEKAEEIIKWASTYLNIDIAPPSEQLTINV